MSRPLRAGLGLVSLCAVVSGLTSMIGFWRRWRRRFRVFVLEYHDVAANGVEHEGTIARERFRRHVRFLKRRYRFVTISQAAAILENQDCLREDLVAVTFDDGFAGNFEAAWPVLAEEGVPATIFVTTAFLDGTEIWFDFARRGLRAAARSAAALPDELRKHLSAAFGRWPLKEPSEERGMELLKCMPPGERNALLEALRDAKLPLEPAARPLSWSQVRKMQAGGVEIGGHTVSHPILPSLSPELQEREILGCRERIAHETGQAPVSFAFPNGDYNETTLEILDRLGFNAACTTRTGSNRPGCNPLTIRRIGVGNDPTWVLSARLSGLFDEEVRQWLPVRSLQQLL